MQNRNLDYLTPRGVERRYGVSRRGLSDRRKARRAPAYMIVSGCVLYRREEIDGFLSAESRQ